MKVLSLFHPCSLQERVSTALASRQYVLDVTSSAEECAQTARLNEYDAILLDADTGSYGDVLILVRLLRHEQPKVALFVFDGRLDLDQRLQLFDAGVDDCVHEPFFPAEFAARLGVSIRLRQAASNLDVAKRGINVLRSGDLELDLLYRTVTRRGRPIDLRPKEFLLLEYLVRNANRPVTRTMILEHVWKSSYEGLTNVVDVYISVLRSKLDQGFGQSLIQTKRGVGYSFTGSFSGQARQMVPEGTYRVSGKISGP